MNDEISEILDNLIKNKEKLKDKTYYPEDLINSEDLILLLDYITNLQKENEYLNNEFNNMTDYAKDLQQEIDRLNNVIEIMEKYFELIIDLGWDYDGLNYEQDLKGLIDDILRFAKLGRVYNTTETIFVDRNKKYNILNEELKEEKE